MIQIPIKRPRRPRVWRPYLSAQDSCHGDHVCEACMECFAAEAEHTRPGHLWTVVDGKIVFMEDQVAASMLGRPLLPTEAVVHKNGDPLINTRENLEIVTMPEMGS